MNTAQNQLNRVSELDHKIRLATGLEIDASSLVGAGGPEDSSPMSLLLPPDEASQVRKIASKLSQIDATLDNQELSLEELDSYFADNESLITATPSIWPVRGLVTSEFGVRASLFHTGESGMHTGLDIAAPPGTLIRAAADGTVTFADWESGYGNLVAVSHGYGLVTRYAHCSGFLVKQGQAVKRGQVIATVGSTGQATGPHVHYEVLVNGVQVNPRKYIFEQ